MASKPKMLTTGHDLPQRVLQIKQDDKFFSRLLSKESSMSESSFRVLYYGGASGAVPFMWESQPGTPKHAFSNSTSLPPLTPPPSYQFNSKLKSMQKGSKPKFLHTIFPKMGSKKNHVMPPSISSSSISSSSSSSYSLPSTPANPCVPGRQYYSSFTRSESAVHFGVDEDDNDDHDQESGSPTSTLCFGFRHGVSREFRGYHAKVSVKNAFLSMIGHSRA